MQINRRIQSRYVVFCYPCLGIIVLAILFQTVAHAAETNLNFNSLEKRLITDGYNHEWIRGIYDRSLVFFEIKGVSRFFVHDEYKLNYDQFLNSKSIHDTKKYMKRYNAELTLSEKIYGVKKEVIAAIILVETRLGLILGETSVINTLSTLATLSNSEYRRQFYNLIPHSRKPNWKTFEKKAIEKSSWAYAELKAFLTYTNREGLDPVTIKGSYAGAMGIAQFMPSNILKYAKDSNQDGRVDLFDHADAIGSIASYLKHYGWRSDLKREKAYQVLLNYNYSKPYANTVLNVANKL